MRTPLLEVRNLSVYFPGSRAHALRGLDLCVGHGEIHGLVGESGSGKSVGARTILGLERPPSVEPKVDRLIFEHHDLTHFPEPKYRKIRGRRMSMVFQEPGKHLNPALTIGEQVTEMLTLHLQLNRRDARLRAIDILRTVELPHPQGILESYPHELSGGMKQRALIGMAISCGPSLLLADEPTTALDVTVQRQILELLVRLSTELEMAILFISHDLAVVQTIAKWVSVIYAGRILETSRAEQLFADPIHPYTQALFDAIPDRTRRGTRLRAIPGQVPDAAHAPAGCPFHPRCPLAEDICRREMPALREYDIDHRAACHVAERIRPVAAVEERRL